MQPLGQTLPNAQPVQPVQQPLQPLAPVASNTPGTAVEIPQKLDVAGLVKTIVIVALSLALVTFIGLFIWKQSQYADARADVEGEIAVAVAAAKDEQALKDEEEFAEREKYPYSTFSGPADYGQLTFEYPRTWSVYVAKDAASGGDFEAYFNPVQVNTVGNNTINALRLTIRDKDFEAVAAEYQKDMEKRDANLTMQAVTVANTAANLYTGTIPGSELSGYIVIFKIRDKTAVLQTDSVLFKEDFDRLLSTITFNA